MAEAPNEGARTAPYAKGMTAASVAEHEFAHQLIVVTREEVGRIKVVFVDEFLTDGVPARSGGPGYGVRPCRFGAHCAPWRTCCGS